MKTQVYMGIISAMLLGPASGLLAADSAADGPGSVDKPLIARWSFDEVHADACADSSGNANDASLEPKG